MKITLFVLLGGMLLSSAFATEREIEGTAGEFGGQPQNWDGRWTVFEPADGRLDVQLSTEGNGEKEHLQINVSSAGEPESGSAKNSSGLFRAINLGSAWAAQSIQTIQFQIGMEDVSQFKKRGSYFGFSSADTSNVAALSSRSSWNLFSYGSPTDVGGVKLQAGELGIRALDQVSGEVTTIPTGIIMESGVPVRVTITISPGSASFDLSLTQGSNSFSRQSLGFWGQKPDASKSFINCFFSSDARNGFGINLAGWSFDPAR